MSPVERNELSDDETDAWVGCLAYFAFFLVLLIIMACIFIITEP